ncbi:MAG: aldehyde ferredoxin oxidoreductase [Defluviitaleaceae bacterium]|nr:aldehyde ferredoxin oxidoreductase [Defluviitaleaceae bacterium]
MSTHFGYAGQVLRVNLTDHTYSSEPVTPYVEFVGGAGIGHKIVWDEVPFGIHPYDPQAKAVIAVGPLTATPVPCSGRTNITFYTPMMKGNPIVDAHIGGHLAQYMKFAGYDAIIIEGKSPNPVYVKIDDGAVTFEPAGHLWGKGTLETNQSVMKDCGPAFTSFAIGPAGENQIYSSTIHGSLGNSGGCGVGGLFGSKNMKALAVRGTGAVAIANPEKVLELTEYMSRDIIGAWFNAAVPRFQQSWAEFTASIGSGTGWNAAPDRFWGGAPSGVVRLGEQPPGDMNKIGYRAHFLFVRWATDAMSEHGEHFKVKAGGCALCPVKCYSRFDVPHARRVTGKSGKFTQACYTSTGGTIVAPGHYGFLTTPANNTMDGLSVVEANWIHNALFHQTWDDLGIFENYMTNGPDFAYAYANGFFRRQSEGGVIPDAQWDSIPWDLFYARDPQWMIWLTEDMAKGPDNGGTELSWMGMGQYHYTKRWNFPKTFWDGTEIHDAAGNVTGRNAVTRMTNYIGYPSHHFIDAYQVSAVRHNLYNRDPVSHVITNFCWCGLPDDETRRVVEAHWGEGCWDGPGVPVQIGARTPINESKINLAHYHYWYYQWSNMATLCEFVWPMTTSPKRERGYMGDLDLDAKFMEAVTGDSWDLSKVQFYADKLSAMMRVMTLVSYYNEYGYTELRESHDKVPEHWFDRVPGQDPFALPPYTETNPSPNSKMCREDWALSQDMFFDRLGWDKVTGVPTRATLNSLDLGFMIDRLEREGLGHLIPS